MALMIENDKKAWTEAMLDTPFRTPEHGKAWTKLEASMMPGNAVKSKEREASGFPKYHGILVAYSEAHVVVRGYNDGMPNSLYVWVGTAAEYHDLFEVD